MKECKNCQKDITDQTAFKCNNCKALFCEECAKKTKNICPHCYNDIDFAD